MLPVARTIGISIGKMGMKKRNAKNPALILKITGSKLLLRNGDSCFREISHLNV